MTDNEHSIATYLSDMLALERHIRIPFEAQLKDDDFSDFGSAKQIVSRLTSLSERHIANLDGALKAAGGHEASPLKSAVSQFEGLVAGVIDKVRKTKVSKALRDDYTALALCTASYTMLHATASAMGKNTVATLAIGHLEDYTKCVMDIAEALPAVVIKELQSIGMNVDAGAIGQSVEATQRAWRPDATTPTV